MEATPNLQLPYLMPQQAQKHVTHNEALELLDCLVQLAVLDRDLAAPPALPAEGDRYLVAAGATGAWEGEDGTIASYLNGGWNFVTPGPGVLAFVADEALFAVFTGSAWIDLGGAIAALQNLVRLGVGTAADAANPFSAKLNAALWTARTVAEGGTGDLRYTLNKEAAGNVLSLLFQSGWSGRAEIGLVGGDDVALKTSADGAAWSEALRIDRATGAATFKAPATVEANSGIALSLDLEGGNGVFQATRYVDGTSAPVFFGRKARGSRAAPAAAQAGDTLIGFRGYGHTGTAFLSGAQGAAFLLEAAETFVHGSSYGTQIRFLTTPLGSTVQAEVGHFASDGAFQMGGANTVINAARHPVLRAYTVATLPAASPAGQLIYVSDGAANKRLAVSDGSGWRWPDGAAVA